MNRVYLDWAATAVPDESIYRGALAEALSHPANPSSMHAPGLAARRRLEEARESIARSLGIGTDTVVFTSGGTESNNIVLSSLLTRPGTGTVVVGGFEHSSVYEPAAALKHNGFGVKTLEATRDGGLTNTAVAAAVDDSTRMVCIMAVNNETGAILPVSDVARSIRQNAPRRVHIHVDAVQALGKIPFSPADLDIDSMSFSGHKIGAPRGSGLLYVRKPITPLPRGGGQEAGMRPGTENLFAIVGLASALERRIAEQDEAAAHALQLKRRLYEAVASVPGAVVIHGESAIDPSLTSPYIFMATFPPVPGEVIVRVMNDRGYAISTGSACSSRKRGDLRVLRAFGYSEREAFSAVRVSTGPATSLRDIDGFVAALSEEIVLLSEVSR